MEKNLTEITSLVAIRLMNSIQEGLTYKSWSEDFSYSEVKRSYQRTLDELNEILGDITKLPVEDLKTLGFKKWNDESNLYLIPLWIYNLIPNGTSLTSIFGNRATKGTDAIDLDVRLGCIAYGIEINV